MYLLEREMVLIKAGNWHLSTFNGHFSYLRKGISKTLKAALTRDDEGHSLERKEHLLDWEKGHGP